MNQTFFDCHPSSLIYRYRNKGGLSFEVTPLSNSRRVTHTHKDKVTPGRTHTYGPPSASLDENRVMYNFGVTTSTKIRVYNRGKNGVSGGSETRHDTFPHPLAERKGLGSKTISPEGVAQDETRTCRVGPRLKPQVVTNRRSSRPGFVPSLVSRPYLRRRVFTLPNLGPEERD